MAITEITSQGFFSRLMESIKGILIGFLMVVISVPLLWWNEGRAVQTAKSLDEGAAAVITVDPSKVDPGNEGKLIHFSGEIKTDEVLKDAQLGVEAMALRLNRVAQMYQWKEKQKKKKRKKVGGGEETETTYTYEKTWSSFLISSKDFKERKGHENPSAMPIQNGDVTTEKAHILAFAIPSSLISSIRGTSTLPIKEKDLENLPPDLRENARISGSGIYIGKDPQNPQIGDLKIMMTQVLPTQVSVFGAQKANALAAYQTKAGDKLLQLANGTKSADAMFKAAQAANTTLTWILRAVGFFLMALGGFLVLNPFAVIADILPFIGSFLRMGIALVSGLLAFFGSFLIIGLAWIFYRPLIGIPLLLVAGGALVWIVSGAIKNRKKSVPA
jgi:hypothetical protein